MIQNQVASENEYKSEGLFKMFIKLKHFNFYKIDNHFEHVFMNLH